MSIQMLLKLISKADNMLNIRLNVNLTESTKVAVAVNIFPEMFTVCKDNLATVMLNKDSVGIKGREFIIY
jgi:hypothetical protein